MYRLLTPVLAVIVAITVFTTFVRPTMEKYKETDRKIAEYEGALNSAQQLQDQISELIKQKNEIDPMDLERLTTLMPDTQDGVAIVLSVDKLAKENRLLLQNISFTNPSMEGAPGSVEETEQVSNDEIISPPNGEADGNIGSAFSGTRDIASMSTKDFYETRELGFDVTGTYEDFKAFIKQLESSLVLMDIKSLSAAGIPENDLSNFSVKITLYQFKNPFAI